ncbi:MAG: glycosyltransferase family 2 protein [Magnetococcus sp. DMHC-1]
MSDPEQYHPRVSIVIPTLNRSSLVGRAIASALSQSYQDLEIIVSNNGSTDDTREVMGRFEDPRLRIFHRDVTIPACEHGNFLISQARGDFFIGLSDDDYLEKDFIAKCVAHFDTYPNLSFVYTGCWIYYNDLATRALTGPLVESGVDFMAAVFAGQRDVCWCACVVRTSHLRTIGEIPPGNLFGDMFYWTRMAFMGNIGCIPEPLSNYIAFNSNWVNVSTGVSILEWAKESQKIINEAYHVVCQFDPTRQNISRIRHDADAYVARSVAKRFVLKAINGGKSRELLYSLLPTLPYLRYGSFNDLKGVVAALLLPRKLLWNLFARYYKKRCIQD